MTSDENDGKLHIKLGQFLFEAITGLAAAVAIAFAQCGAGAIEVGIRLPLSAGGGGGPLIDPPQGRPDDAGGR